MKIRFDVSLDDILAYNRYHVRHSPSIRRSTLLIRWGGAILFLLICLLPAYDFEPGYWLMSLFLGLVGGITFLLLYPVLVRVVAESQQRKLYTEGSTRGEIGMHECELGEDGVIVRSETGELKTRWEGLDRIVTTDDYTFIYLSSVTAHVIPRRGVVEGDYGSFVRALMDRFQEVRESPQS
jgi:hypothetical protein